MSKCIFLDNDGVICLLNNWGRRDKLIIKYIKENPGTLLRDIPVQYRFDGFDRKAIKVLNRILQETDADVVISSDWKLYATLEELQEYYIGQGIIKAPIAITPNMKDFDPDQCSLFIWKQWLERIRVAEIREYLRLNSDITSWVAIDDLDMGLEGLENFYLTDEYGKEGIKKSGLADKIINFLKSS